MERSPRGLHDDANYLFFNELNRMSGNENGNGENGNPYAGADRLFGIPEGEENNGNTPVNATAFNTKKGSTTVKKAKVKRSQVALNAMQKGRETKRAKNAAQLALRKKLLGRYIYPGEKNESGEQKPATDQDLVMLEAIEQAAVAEGTLLSVPEQVAILIKQKAEMPAKRVKVKYSPNTKLNRKSIRKTLRDFKINPSAARVNAYTKRRANFAGLKKNIAENRKTLLNYFAAEKAGSPELQGLRKSKADAKARLEGAKNDAEESLLRIAKERTVKGKLVKTVNPATVKHLAELRLAGYKITPEEIVHLSSLVKQVKDATTRAALANDATMKRLVSDGKKMNNACDRCLLTTIFGQEMP